MNLRFRLLLATVFLAFTATASASGLPLSAAQNARIESLAADNHWHTLLHAKPEGMIHKTWQSQVDDNKFFLAQTGKTDPAAELRATLQAFYAPVENPDQHAICRFPARWQWLSLELQLPAPPLTPQQCPDFSKWLGIIQPNSVTLVFASSYLNSPSSMFGHTFLRIDPANIKTGTNWLSYAVNFGAELHPEDNSILYAYKGLFGGYPGFFSVMRYHDKINEYSRLENRDLWEYQLNLTPDEVQHLVWHLWELKNIDFDYYFFDENCSYRLLELLEVARPGTDLTSPFKARAIPVDTVRAVKQAGMISATVYRPSEATDLQFQADRLSDAQQQLAWDIAHHKRGLDDTGLLALPVATQVQVLRVAYKHLRYLQLHKERDPDRARDSLLILKALRDKPAQAVIEPPRPTAPEQGHDTLLAGLSGGRSDGTGFLDLRLRTSYHDLLDAPDGYLNGAAINIGELQLRQRDSDSLQVEMLNFVDINSHSPQNTFFHPITWRVRAGFDRVYSATDDALAPRVNGGAGITRLIDDRDFWYAMGIARVEYNPLLESNFAVGAGALAGSLFYLPFGTLQLEGEYYRFSDGRERADLKLIHNLPLGKNDAVRFSALHRKQLDTRYDEISLEYRHYY